MTDSDVDPTEHEYPQSCPFCTNADAFPSTASSEDSVVSLNSSIPEEVDVTKTSPSCFLVLSAPTVMAFLDILPMTPGHLLVTVRKHRRKVEHLEADESRDIGFWLPLLSKAVKQVTGTSDYNIVQNNGIRAAQVVPHVHFHIIPRPAKMPELKNKSWTMFGRGQREDLDDEEGEKLAAEIRRELRKEVDARFSSKSGSKL